jgi:hypothetical protein
LEKRLLTLEQETLQNNLLFEKFIRRLDEKFEITKNADLTAIKVRFTFWHILAAQLLCLGHLPILRYTLSADNL